MLLRQPEVASPFVSSRSRVSSCQLELDGYTKARAIASITHVQADAVSGTEAAKLGGDMLAESIAKELSAGTWITVRGNPAPG